MTLELASAFSQTTSQPAPKSPVLARAPSFADWTVTFNYKGDEKKPGGVAGQPSLNAGPAIPADSLQSLTVSKTKKTYREETIFKSGMKGEKWIYDNIELMQVPGTDSIVPIDPPTQEAPSPDYSDYSKSDFPELNWLTLDHYKGIQTYQGKPAYLFESTNPGEKCVALLAVETQLPLSFTEGKVVRTYVFNPPPTAPLIPPENFLKVLKKHKRGLEKLTLKRFYLGRRISFPCNPVTGGNRRWRDGTPRG